MDTSRIAATAFFFRPMTNVFPTCSRRSAGGPAGRTGPGSPPGIRAGDSTCADRDLRTVIFCSGVKVVLTAVAPVSRVGVRTRCAGLLRATLLENEKSREPDVCPCVDGLRLRVAAPRRRGNEKAAVPWPGPRLRFLFWRRYRRETRPSW